MDMLAIDSRLLAMLRGRLGSFNTGGEELWPSEADDIFGAFIGSDNDFSLIQHQPLSEPLTNVESNQNDFHKRKTVRVPNCDSLASASMCHDTRYRIGLV